MMKTLKWKHIGEQTNHTEYLTWYYHFDLHYYFFFVVKNVSDKSWIILKRLHSDVINFFVDEYIENL